MMKLFVHPFCRRDLNVFYDVSEPMRCAKADKKVDVIVGPTDRLRNASGSFQTAAKELVQTFSPFLFNAQPVVLCVEDEMHVQAEMCLGHRFSVTPAV
jgi:hypothetical protein